MYKASIILFLLSITSFNITAQNNKSSTYPKALANYDDFKNLVLEIEDFRKNRLISLNEFIKISKTKNTIILDTRSKDRYDRKHIKGAIHLSFTDFTQENLEKLIPDNNTRILIYCNNNFKGDQIDFASKVYTPTNTKDIENQILSNKNKLMLALNIPTFINLYGYSFNNIYELDELVNINDKRIQFKGSEVFTTP